MGALALKIILSPIGRYAIAALVVIGALGGAYGYLRVHNYNQGFNDAIAKIAAKDRKALDAVQIKLQEVDDCYRANREWDTTRGVCN